MSNTNSSLDLGQCIEKLIPEHPAASRVFAQEKVVRGFAEASRPPPGPARRTKSSPGKKRPSADIAALGEQFYRAVSAKPGETMTVLGAEVGASARELALLLLRLVLVTALSTLVRRIRGRRQVRLGRVLSDLRAELGHLLHQRPDLLLELGDALVTGAKLGLQLLYPLASPVAPHAQRSARAGAS